MHTYVPWYIYRAVPPRLSSCASPPTDRATTDRRTVRDNRKSGRERRCCASGSWRPHCAAAARSAVPRQLSAVTSSEAAPGAVAAPRNLSLAVDCNGDGLISLEEVRAWSVAQFGVAAAEAPAEPLAPRLLQADDATGSSGCPCIDPWNDTDDLVAAGSHSHGP